MDYDAAREELERTRILLHEHQKYLKRLELKSARFGIHLPPYLEVDIDNTKEKIEICVKRLDLMVEGANKLRELHERTESLKELAVDYAWYIIHFADPEDHTQNAIEIQELGIEIAGMIIAIDKINKEYIELTKQYGDLL